MSIEVYRSEDSPPYAFDVTIVEGRSQTRHRVTMDENTYARLTTGAHTPEHCVEAAFRFLLEREAKEAILERFDVAVISRYFPEFEGELPRYLAED